MSAFSKRKARIIKVGDDDALDPPDTVAEEAENGTSPAPVSRTSLMEASKTDVLAPVPVQPSFKNARRPFKQSGLRKSINFNDQDDTVSKAHTDESAPTNDEEDSGSQPVVVRPNIGRSSSIKQKKRPSSSRLSFGREDKPEDATEESAVVTPKRNPLAQRAVENNAKRKSITLSRLPMRSFADDDDRPRYSKEYLDELQSSTPNTPQNVSVLDPAAEDEMELDASELEGALIVDEGPVVRDDAPAILSETQIRERKDRRARLAQEQDYIALDDDDDDRGSLAQRTKNDTRLVQEDEDLGEGFDEFVEDGGLSLGKKAEREARRRQRKEMADLILEAEAGSEDSDDSEAERLEAFEKAQTRAGMDGLKRPDDAVDKARRKPKMGPIPTLSEALKPLHGALASVQEELVATRLQIATLKEERQQIAADLKEREAKTKLLDEPDTNEVKEGEPTELEIPQETSAADEGKNGTSETVDVIDGTGPGRPSTSPET